MGSTVKEGHSYCYLPAAGEFPDGSQPGHFAIVVAMTLAFSRTISLCCGKSFQSFSIGGAKI